MLTSVRRCATQNKDISTLLFLHADDNVCSFCENSKLKLCSYLLDFTF